MTSSMLISLLLALLAILDASELISAWGVILIASLISVITGVDWPTRNAIFPSLIDKEDMMSAIALNSIIWQSSRMVMPILGGFVIALVDTWLVFALCSAGFLCMFFVIAGLKLKPADTSKDEGTVKTSTLSQVREGLSFIFNNRIFLVLISLSYAGMFFGMSHLQLMPSFSALLGSGEKGYGLLISATGVGSVLGTILIGSFQQSPSLGRIMLTCSSLVAVCGFIFSYATANANDFTLSYLVAISALLIGSSFNSMYMILSMTTLQLRVPDRLRGRVMGFYGITYSMIPLGGLFAGFIASYSSPPVAIMVNSCLYILFILFIAISQPEIRTIKAK